MKHTLFVTFILLSFTVFSQTKEKTKSNFQAAAPAKLASDTVRKSAFAASLDSAQASYTEPILSAEDMTIILYYLDDKLLSRDHRIVQDAIMRVVDEARKRKKHKTP